MPTNNNLFFKVWGMPVFLGIITIAGLLLAIMGTGIWHFFSWIALLVPVYLVIKKVIKCVR